MELIQFLINSLLHGVLSLHPILYKSALSLGAIKTDATTEYFLAASSPADYPQDQEMGPHLDWCDDRPTTTRLLVWRVSSEDSEGSWLSPLGRAFSLFISVLSSGSRKM